MNAASKTMIVLAFGMLLNAGGARAQDADPLPHWRDDPQTCRDMTEALLRNRVTDATDAVIPDNATDRLRKNVRGLMHRLNDGLTQGAAGRPPEFERVMPDADLDGQKVSVESWYFGDELFLVGCVIVPHGRSAHISIQAYPTLQDVLDHLREDGKSDDTHRIE